MLGAGILVLLSAIYFVWSVQKEWGPVIELRIREHRSLASVRVLAKSENGEEKWIGALSAGRLEERSPVSLSEIPPLLTQAIVTLEDPRFLSHEGVDTIGIARAIWANIKAMRYAQGGSTITQQLVKNIFLSNDKKLKRKLTEWILAPMVESTFSKDEVLEAYLNEIYFGQLGAYGVHGVARASDYYFGKSLDKLELHEMALIAALVKGPGYYDPWKHPQRAIDRRNFVLKKLAESNLIMEQEYAAAKMQALPSRKQQLAQVKAPYLMDALRQTLIAERGETELIKGAFDILLDIDLPMQQAAENVLAKRAEQWPAELQASFIAADPRTCTIKAYAGGTLYQISQLDHIRQIKRAMGSLIKPLLIQNLLNSPDENYNLASTVEDAPFKWSFDKDRSQWSPQNYDHKYRGMVSIRQILEQSLNVPMAKLFFARAPNGLLWNELYPIRELGLEIPQERALPSALLGSIEQSPWVVMETYLRFTRRAMGLAETAADLECKLSFAAVESVAKTDKDSDADSEISDDQDKQIENPFGVEGAQLTLAALQGALRRGTSASLGSKIDKNQFWAGKTGTSSDLRDSWYVAMSPHLVALSWVGRDDNKETKFTGATAALPIVAEIILPYSKTVESWQWPQSSKLEWQMVERARACLAPKTIKSALPPQTTPPPEDFSIDGTRYYWELFKAESLPKRCEDL